MKKETTRKIKKAIKHPVLYWYDFYLKRSINSISIRLEQNKEKNNLLFVTQELTYTGSPNSLLRMARVAKQRMNVVILSIKDGPFKREFTKYNLPYIVVKSSDFDKPYLSDFIAKFNYCIANTIGTSEFVKAYEDSLPIIWFIREAQNLPQYSKARQRLLDGYPNVYCVSEYAKEFIDKTYHVSAKICENCVDDEYNKSFIKTSGKYKFLITGTISARKGFDVAVEAWSKLPASIKIQCELHIVGRVIPSFKEFFESSIKPMLGKNIFYHGEITDRLKYLSLLGSCDCVIVPSRDESCSLVALEGAMMSKPIIVTENVGAKYICKYGAGEIVKTGSSQSLIEAVVKYVESGRDNLEKKGQQARKNYLESSTFDLYEKRVNLLLDDLISKKPRINNIFAKEGIRKNNRPYIFITYDDLSKDIQKHINFIAGDIDMVVGIPRSGMIPAYIIAFMKNLKVCSLNEFISGTYNIKYGYRKINDNPIKNVLIVDDSILSGRALNDAKTLLKESKIDKKFNLIYCCIYATSKMISNIDRYAELVRPPRLFQWNYLNHPHSVHWCYDIDGVLCEDPDESVNDDGDKYRNFILNAPLLFKPKYKIGALVTSRLEKYRKETEEWAQKHGIEYNHLIMLDLPSQEDRIKLKAHTKTKIDFYSKNPNMNLFIESNRKQAEEIARACYKPVICTENNKLYYYPIDNQQEVIEVYKSMFYCNVCNSSFNEYKSFGTIPRKCKCPVCGSFERTRLIWMILIGKLFELRDKRILCLVKSSIIKNLILSENPTAIFISKINEINDYKNIDYFISDENLVHTEKEFKDFVCLLRNFSSSFQLIIPIPDSLKILDKNAIANNLVIVDSKSYPQEIYNKFNIRGKVVIVNL